MGHKENIVARNYVEQTKNAIEADILFMLLDVNN